MRKVPEFNFRFPSFATLDLWLLRLPCPRFHALPGGGTVSNESQLGNLCPQPPAAWSLAGVLSSRAMSVTRHACSRPGRRTPSFSRLEPLAICRWAQARFPGPSYRSHIRSGRRCNQRPPRKTSTSMTPTCRWSQRYVPPSLAKHLRRAIALARSWAMESMQGTHTRLGLALGE